MISEVNVIADKERTKSRSGGGVGNVWLRASREKQGEPPLTRARIVDAAVALLDDEGMGRLTMRRLAERLQVGATTLYWHVATKDDVVDLAVDAIFGETQVPDRHADSPREDIATLVDGWRKAMLRHPWAATLPARQRPLMGPNFLAWMEFLQSALVRAGVTGKRLHAATWALYNHVMGATAAQSSLQLSAEETRLGQEYLENRRERYPTVAANNYIADDDWDANFSLGLEFLLDGIEAGSRP
ncbi:transcriptional regulator [Streptomyces albus subsp. chlorinus]|uniref:Transcriptional regulator n=1 Tax=Streptomyces albus subsp. chlorinus TaxID=337066 RepID=A0A3G4YJW3_9ACTN|nr:transcriptional regulator [Streptomyces albus subsp. chlorinus]UZN59873.1 transcriptional regulator [Streptomyces albus subsp. chlorinus] [Streptomyces sp. GBA 94-10 4N24]UZQ37612.1 transcriptional regulator [Streptomyces albus subsp. chlorinus] [Streptomyces sp. Je 1-4 4N24]UZQ45029.1 transcriptional regulator [Streptomyces albus subsp. chlorinus] [Streptomyces sp. Je 1-4 4N24_ara]WAE19986.1 transcriptional regulator [Streptomyces albus subsp. chlorinus] [Streptomyces albidoflavus]